MDMNLNLGNIIQNGNNKSFNGNLNLPLLYNKVPYFKKLLAAKKDNKDDKKASKKPEPPKKDKDGKSDKDKEVPKMRQYYTNASYTLISINTELGDTSNIDMMDILKKVINSEWFTRSWTYQEG